MNLKMGLKIVYGTGIFAGIIALIMGITGNWGGFFGALFVCLGFVGLGWAGKRIFSAGEGGKPRLTISLVIGVMFGGAGLIMLVASVAFFVDEDFPAAIGMLVFGLIFCGVAYFGSRAFAIPKGTKAVLVGKGTKSIDGVLGQSGKLSGSTYVFVDEKTPDAEIEKMQNNWTTKPWTQRGDWAEGMVVQEGTFDMRLLTAFAVIWNIISWGIAGYGIWTSWDSIDIPWFLLLFPVMGIVFVIITVRTWIRKHKFGISILRCRTMPFYLGDRLQGTVETGVTTKNQIAKEFFIELNCVKRTTRIDQGGDDRVSEKKLWTQRQTVFGSISATGSTFQVSVDVDIPADLPPTELTPEDDRTLWRLHITSPVEGIDYAAQFEVPIYRGMDIATTETSVKGI